MLASDFQQHCHLPVHQTGDTNRQRHLGGVNAVRLLVQDGAIEASTRNGLTIGISRVAIDNSTRPPLGRATEQASRCKSQLASGKTETSALGNKIGDSL